VSSSRRQLLERAAFGILGAGGLYGLVDQLAAPPPARAAAAPLPEQHLLGSVRVVREDGIEVLVPPLHHEVITARVLVERGDLTDARSTFEHLLAGLDADYAPTPAGLGVTIAWGLPYFRRLVPGAARAHLPYDRRAGKPALLDARRFPSDPRHTVLEANDVAMLLRSDRRAHIDDAAARIRASGIFRVTSLRRGFVGGGLPRRMAIAAGLPGAELIPDGAELFLGFTSTQRSAFGPGKIANFETLGFVDTGDTGYFRDGTHMHLSHLVEDLEAWYVNFAFHERLDSAFKPGLTARAGARTVSMQVASAGDVRREYASSGRIGHSASIQTASRLQSDVRGPDGTLYRKGTAVPIRADFNTLDNPFLTSGAEPAAGLHFVVFNPSSDDFNRTRLAMDGVLPGGSLGIRPRDRAQGFNSVLRTTHRQNFIVPPRRHRSFPLSEL
jgi:hypothetical protein